MSAAQESEFIYKNSFITRRRIFLYKKQTEKKNFWWFVRNQSIVRINLEKNLTNPYDIQ